MATRYVWDRYNTVDVPSGIYEEKILDSVIGSYDTTRISGFPKNNWVGCTEKPVGPDSNGCYTPAGETFVSGNFMGALAIIQSDYPYFMVTDSVANRRRYYYNLGSYNAEWWVDTRYSTDTDAYVELHWITTQGKLSMNVVEAVEGVTKGPGTLLGQNTSTSNSTYPSNGLSGSYWYKYKGSDNIDPTKISYSKNDPKGGDSITATVTPRANTYGGTIYYQYQYSTNGGSSWTNQGGKTTSTTLAFTIPKGAAQFRVRVVASDNYGFTSTTYVTGANLAVTNMRVYIGVGGKARKVGNLYIGVNGKARKVVKGYIGDANGKARAWF